MLSANQLGALIGGTGLFLLGMWLMTEGLRLAAGAALREVLARSTRTRWRALGSGIMLTAVVHSSSAVTVAAIGFVNASLLSPGQVLWVLFGLNVGTAMTGWLVALLGLQIKIDLLALPLIGVGMLLRLTGGASRRGGFGLALAGFGVLLLGIDVLRDAFSAITAGLSFPRGEGLWGVVAHMLFGVVLTLLMQSSSAATALTLTAAKGGLLGLEAAAAVVIGSNIGTAVLAAIGVTSNARRATAAHVLFNVLTAAVALAILPWLLDLTQGIGAWTGAPSGIATVLELFHTVFNVLGVLLMWPLADRAAAFLAQRFRTAEEDEARPRYLDAATAQQAAILARARLTPTALDAAIDDFVVRLNRAGMAPESARRLAAVLRRAGYYASVAEQLGALPVTDAESPVSAQGAVEEVAAMRREAGDVHRHLDLQGSGDEGITMTGARVAAWDEIYRRAKASLLDAAAAGQLPPDATEALLRSNSALRRAVQQAYKAISSDARAGPVPEAPIAAGARGLRGLRNAGEACGR